jgi:hypothetical protein
MPKLLVSEDFYCNLFYSFSEHIETPVFLLRNMRPSFTHVYDYGNSLICSLPRPSLGLMILRAVVYCRRQTSEDMPLLWFIPLNGLNKLKLTARPICLRRFSTPTDLWDTTATPTSQGRIVWTSKIHHTWNYTQKFFTRLPLCCLSQKDRQPAYKACSSSCL